MLHAPIRTMGLMCAAGILTAAFAWGQQPAATPKAATPKAAPQAKGTAGTAGTDEVAVLETTKGRMVLEFWEKEAPQTVANFKKLARQGFYDGTGFHRIIKGFMIQGGDPKSKNPKAPDLGTGDPGYKIKDEFSARKHVPGVISMANSGTPNSAGSQFFLMHGPASFLDGKYTAFGRVIEGMNVLNDIATTPVGPNQMMGGEQSKPLEWTTLKSVKITPRSAMAKAKPAATGTLKAGAAAKGGVDMKAATEKAAAPAATSGSSTSSKPPASSAAPETPQESAPAEKAPAPSDTSQTK